VFGTRSVSYLSLVISAAEVAMDGCPSVCLEHGRYPT
jgi:hypothetical protein